MSEALNNKQDSFNEDEINLQEFFNVLFKGKWIIISVTAFVSVVGVVYSLLLPNIYESKAVLVPVDSSNGISAALKGYSGLASLAGISLPAQGDEGNSTKALKKINSLSFFEKNLLPKIFLPDLMALKYWDHQTNTLIYDESIYNNTTNEWVREYDYPRTLIPSAQESFKVFQDNLSINEDIKTGFVTLAIKHQSPYIAKKWTDLVINEINSFYRKKDKLESLKAVSYLNKQISTTNLTEVKQAIASLLQNETQKLTLIEANEFYVFEFIDPPAIMEIKAEPKRAVICILAALFGGMLGFVIVLTGHFVFKRPFLT
jgi:hypothetical protein